MRKNGILGTSGNIPNFISLGETYYEAAATKRKFLSRYIYLKAVRDIMTMWAAADETRRKVAENIEKAKAHYDSKVVAEKFLASLA